MLWRKAWRESRTRFFVCLAFCMLPSLNFIFWQNVLSPWDTDGPPFYFKNLYGRHVLLSVVCIFSTVLLGLGGLLREKAAGSSSFTLGLPVSRSRLIAVRAGIGVLQTIVLAVLPWLANWAISLVRGMPFSRSQAGGLLCLLLGVGVVCFAMGVLVSSLVEGEYTAAAVAFGFVAFAIFLSENVLWLKDFDPLTLATGVTYIDKRTFLFTAQLPWSILCGSIIASVLMVLTSIAITVRRDF